MVLKAFPKPGKNSLHLNSETNSQNNSNENNKILLTEREQEVLKLLVDGKSNTEIAYELIVSVHTAKAHVCSILQKLCVEDRVQAAVKAIRQGLV
ncbi:MAG: response regulator transcription factor [Candidatus Melainabacteria bacterium]|nr:MAG: response regulator transcription factor [Candidatus Melainabacteria bacterium]